MEQLKSLYETIFIVNNTIGEEAVKAWWKNSPSLFRTMRGRIVNEWGVRKLAYPIQDLTEGLLCSREVHCAARISGGAEQALQHQ